MLIVLLPRNCFSPFTKYLLSPLSEDCRSSSFLTFFSLLSGFNVRFLSLEHGGVDLEAVLSIEQDAFAGLTADCVQADDGGGGHSLGDLLIQLVGLNDESIRRHVVAQHNADLLSNLVEDAEIGVVHVDLN